ncbi:Proteins of 100 residues with WXG [Actinopolyspora xinjiangensis]|uniref:Proteins of 100 residues with WXG n=1 Tax=Actinopolyspora xinjiangensis TaxID=405564 RepID=A0A1H0VRP3_9ACTN|nr:WXG100 family type VII secretion target [Actinopolyspora xinjiangensis]SDP81187.1 Proteins of 100 residues with WXG [Actinopolyspora xinjiangensis]
MSGNSEYPALGFDPAPGAVATVESVATDLGNVATRMGSAHEALSKISDQEGMWQGKAAEAFQDTVGELPKYLQQAHRSLGDASRTLTRWSHDLSSLQQRARDYEAQAAEARKRLREAEANPDLDLANQHFPDQESLQRAQRRLDAAQGALREADNDLRAILDQAKRLLAQHDELAKQVENALRRATEEAPEKPGLLERLGEALEELGENISELADQAWQWVEDHAELLKQIGDVLSTVSTVLGVVAIATSWIPGVNAVTSAAAITVSAAALGTNALAKAGGADVSWGKIGMDAIGVIPGGRVVAGAKNAASQAARFASASSLPGKAGNAAKFLSGTSGLKKQSDVLKQMTGRTEITPITRAELKANPKEAIEDAAMFTHAKSAQLFSTVTRIDVDPFSKAGVAAGAFVGSVKGVAVNEGMSYASGKAESYIQSKLE